MYSQLRLFPDEPWLYSSRTVLNGHLSMPVQPPAPLPPILNEACEATTYGVRFVALFLTGYLPKQMVGPDAFFRGIAITVKPQRTTITLKRWHQSRAEVAFISDQTRAKALRSLFTRREGENLNWQPDNYA